ncbi:MAG: M48 family metalloprotease [Verrucomicrobia bacterium]|nr:M48 family metalloprotease [Verrucomicrobiota bacterium]MCH8511009.1 M48 family metalloprotease [Kiritimatiellia bacterium]
MKPLRIFLSALLLGLLIYGCATNPVTGRSELALISEQQEIALGRDNYGYQQQLQGGPYLLDDELTRYVREVGEKLARVSDRPHLPYEFVVLNDSTWNAWAMPGGKIAINRGLLKSLRNESELAAVLAHEIVHVAARHSAQQMQRGMMLQLGVAGAAGLAGENRGDIVQTVGGLAGGLGLLRYSRAAEIEADYYGILYMVDAGYDPVGAVTLQEMFAENQRSAGGWLASHPASVERVRRNREAIERNRSENGYIGENEYRVRTRNLRDRAPAYELYDQGLEALKNNRHQEALRLANEAQNVEPREALFHGLEAKAHEAMNNPNAALRAWDQAIQLNSEWFLFHLERGLLHEKAGRHTQARRDLERSFELLPTQTAKDALERLGVSIG